MAWMLVSLSAALASPAEDAAPESMDAVLRALSSRDPISCEIIEALTPTPTATLLAVVAEIERPPWAPMRAANCLLQRHASEIQPDIERWVVEPELRGLGRLVLDSLDRMPLEVSLPVARKALAEGSDRTLAAARIAQSASPQIREIAVKP